MQPVTKKTLKRLIAEGEAAGIDVSDLKKKLANWDDYPPKKSPMGETTKVGNTITFSTGPIKKWCPD